MHTTNLTELHKQVKFMLRFKRPESARFGPNLSYCDESTYPGYDWFVSIFFLVNRGDVGATLDFLLDVVRLRGSELVWPALNYAMKHKIHNGMNVLLLTTCHYLELILKTEQPLIFSAFRMSGLAPSQICLHWIKQSFLNYLDLPDLVTYLALCFVLGLDYQTYFCVVILRHLNFNQNIVQHHTNRDLQFFLRVFIYKKKIVLT